MQGSGTGAATPSGSPEPVRLGDTAKRLVARVEQIAARSSAERPPRARPSESGRDWSTGRGRWLLDTLLKRAGVPEKYRNGEWEKCSAAADLQPWVANLRNHAAAGRGLILTGPVGTGKSTTAGIVARTAIQTGLSVQWEYVPSLLDEMEDRGLKRAAFARQRFVDVLVLDDFGVANLQAWQIPLIDKIVEHRYGRHLSTIVTSNVPLSMMAGDEAISRFVDRWRERMTGVELVGASMRQRPQ